MPVKLWGGWGKLHVKGTRIECGWAQGFFWRLYIITVTASEGWSHLSLHRYRKHKVSNNNDETEQEDLLCPGTHRSSWHLVAPFSCFPCHTNPCPQSHVNAGMERWKDSRWCCSLFAAWCFASFPDLHLQLLLSPSQISLSPVIFHHWRRHWVFSSAWNIHWEESSLFCSMCFC